MHDFSAKQNNTKDGLRLSVWIFQAA